MRVIVKNELIDPRNKQYEVKFDDLVSRSLSLVQGSTLCYQLTVMLYDLDLISILSVLSIKVKDERL